MTLLDSCSMVRKVERLSNELIHAARVSRAKHLASKSDHPLMREYGRDCLDAARDRRRCLERWASAIDELRRHDATGTAKAMVDDAMLRAYGSGLSLDDPADDDPAPPDQHPAIPAEVTA